MIILNMPMVQIRGEWVPNVNQKGLQERVIEALVHKQSRLTGNEIRFIRLFAGMTLERFAARLDVSHPAVLKWEKKKDCFTGMNWSTEKDIRLFALLKVKTGHQRFFATYSALEKALPDEHRPIKIDLEKKSA